ncbi:glycosyltransferase [Massilia sp. WF1]|uniref:glycosyltransferase n=1 Tax=Massilia sp. WF1 TaxID=1406431 RepID=UPI000A07BBCC
MFEYMSSGIPVIASDFPYGREIIEGNRCGMCVDPLDPRALAAAIDYPRCPSGYREIDGENGRKAVLEKYNWTVQAKRLTDFYGAISHVKQTAAAA